MLRLWLPQSTLFIAEHDLQILDESDLFKALEIVCVRCVLGWMRNQVRCMCYSMAALYFWWFVCLKGHRQDNTGFGALALGYEGSGSSCRLKPVKSL